LHSQAHIDTAKKYLFVRELTGKNDGAEIEMFLKSVGRKKGDSWCAAFVSYVLTVNKIKVPNVRSGLARDFITKTNKKNISLINNVMLNKSKIQKGDLVVWGWENSYKGHIAFLTGYDIKSNKFYTIEGNTSSGIKGSQDNGDGVYRRIRRYEPANYFRMRWIVKVENEKLFNIVDN